MALPLLGVGLVTTILSAVVAGMVMRVILAFGISIVTYIGLNQIMDYVNDAVVNALSDIQALGDIYSILVLASVPQAIQLVMSAATGVIALRVGVGFIRRITWGGS